MRRQMSNCTVEHLPTPPVIDALGDAAAELAEFRTTTTTRNFSSVRRDSLRNLAAYSGTIAGVVFSSCETAVTIWPIAKGLAIIRLLGTPFDAHSLALAPDM